MLHEIYESPRGIKVVAYTPAEVNDFVSWGYKKVDEEHAGEAPEAPNPEVPSAPEASVGNEAPVPTKAAKSVRPRSAE
jgi:hypothetical protein